MSTMNIPFPTYSRPMWTNGLPSEVSALAANMGTGSSAGIGIDNACVSCSSKASAPHPQLRPTGPISMLCVAGFTKSGKSDKVGSAGILLARNP